MATVTSLADELIALQFRADPLRPALLGFDPPRPGLADLSEQAERARAAELSELAARARELAPDNLTPADRVTRDVLLSQVRAELDQIASRMAEFTVSDLFIAPAAGLLHQLPILTVTGAEGARAHLDRLAAIPDYLGQALDRHRAGVAAGRVPVARHVTAAVDHLDRYLAGPADDRLLRQEISDAGLAEQRERLVADVVRPAFAAYRDGLAAEIAPHGRADDRPGVCWLPDGERIYATLARVHTTTERSPAELHETGLRLIEQLADEYRDVGSRVLGTSDLGEIFTRLRTDPALRWDTGEELLDSARTAIERAERAAPDWFGHVPTRPCLVEPVSAADAPGAPLAYYMWPSTDGTRPGTYFANTHRVTERFRHTSEAIAFHEAVPGHHFQISTALGLTGLPLLRQLCRFAAYMEGWGLYAERLADEMGLYSGDLARLGMLTQDSMRAGRLVVDTGLHALGWSRQAAIDYLAEHTPMAQLEIEAEVDRYIVWPGQALAYMVGRLEVQRIRGEAELTLRANFDIKAFHDVLLGNGALPLPVLDSVVRDWVREGNHG